MSEGTALRELAARALMDHAVAQNPGLEHFAEGILAHLYHGWADAVLAALTQAGALAPAGLTSDSFTEEDFYTIGLAAEVTGYDLEHKVERRFAGMALVERLHACGFAVVRVAPAADAATGAPS